MSVETHLHKEHVKMAGEVFTDSFKIATILENQAILAAKLDWLIEEYKGQRFVLDSLIEQGEHNTASLEKMAMRIPVWNDHLEPRLTSCSETGL